MYEIELEKAKAQLERVIQTALDGEEVIITQNQEAVLKLVPVPRSNGGRKAGSAKGLVSMAEDFDEPLEDFKEYLQRSCCSTRTRFSGSSKIARN